MDHVLPRSVGGGDHFGNLVLACFKCNASKSNDPTIMPTLSSRFPNEMTLECAEYLRRRTPEEALMADRIKNCLRDESFKRIVFEEVRKSLISS